MSWTVRKLSGLSVTKKRSPGSPEKSWIQWPQPAGSFSLLEDTSWVKSFHPWKPKPLLNGRHLWIILKPTMVSAGCFITGEGISSWANSFALTMRDQILLLRLQSLPMSFEKPFQMPNCIYIYIFTLLDLSPFVHPLPWSAVNPWIQA